MRLKLNNFAATTGVVLCLAACSKDVSPTEQESKTDYPFNAQEEFAIILSKALYSSEEMRTFVRDEASRQFDMDYDVFFPIVKDKAVDGSRTFRNILKDNDKADVLERIESERPLLNILIPDWSWASGFCADSWDVSDCDVSVAVDNQDSGLQLYNNGEKEYLLEYGQLSQFPIVIVNNNDRMKVSTATKSGDLVYEFIDSEFDGVQHIQTKADYEYYNRTVPTEDYSNFVPATELMHRCI